MATRVSVEDDRWEALEDQAVANAGMSGPGLYHEYVALQSLGQANVAGEN